MLDNERKMKRGKTLKRAMKVGVIGFIVLLVSVF